MGFHAALLPNRIYTLVSDFLYTVDAGYIGIE
jgi:hypothetical protein